MQLQWNDRLDRIAYYREMSKIQCDQWVIDKVKFAKSIEIFFKNGDDVE